MSEGPTVLVVDDDESIRVALERALRLEGFAVQSAGGGLEALELVDRDPPAVMVLDVTMPDISGVTVTARLRARGVDVPICILSARDEVHDRVAGLQAGADDYVVKPFDLEELVARLHALLRRSPASTGAELRVGDLRIDPARRQVARAGRDIELTFPRILIYVLIPQAMRQIMPVWVNTGAELVKASTLLSVIGTGELLLRTQEIVGRNFMTLEFYGFCGLLYFLINSVIERLGKFASQRFALQ